MEQATLGLWTKRARQAQGRLRRKPRRIRLTFIASENDFLKLERHISRRLAAMLEVEKLSNLMDEA